MCECGEWPEVALPTGVNLGALFVPEAWMFAPRASPGSSFPPVLGVQEWAQDVGERWRSGAHLTHLLLARLGAARALECFQEHWTRYFVPDEVCGALRARGIRRLRIPLPWAMFPPPEEMGFQEQGGFVADPFALEKTLFPVCSAHRFLTRWLETAERHQITALLDLHTLPGQTGPGFAPMLWPTATSAMSTSERADWLEACTAVWRGLLLYVRSLPPRLRRGVHGLQPSNLGLWMDTFAMTLPRFPINWEVSAMARDMSDRAIVEFVRVLSQDTSSALSVYINIDGAMSPAQVEEYLTGAVRSLSERSHDVKIVRARHLFALTWDQIFTLPFERNIADWVEAAFGAQRSLMWGECCVEWSAAPPQSEIFERRGETALDPLRFQWKTGIYQGFLRAFESMGIENYFWTWDLPDCCSADPHAHQARTFWSLACVLGVSRDAAP